MNRSRRLALTAAAMLPAMGLSAAVHAAIIVDPALVTGANAIDPAGSETIDSRPGQNLTGGNRTAEVNFITEANLEARSDFKGAIQSLGTGMGGTTNYIQFTTDASLADIRITSSTTAADIANSGRVTSGTAGFAQSAQGTVLFEFGDFDGTTFTLGKVVDAVGFTIGNVRFTNGSSFQVLFKNSLGNVVSTQNITGVDEGGTGSSGGIEGFFSYAGDATLANGIASILVTRTGGGNINTSIDDFGFTSAISTGIPEPASFALLGLGGLLMLGRRRA